MLQNNFQIFTFIGLYMIFKMKCDILHENYTTEVEPFPDILPREKCELGLCICDDFGKLGGISTGCRENYITQITFDRIKYLPAGTFLGFRINRMILNNPEMIIEENFLKGILFLSELIVEQSSLEIIPNFKMVMSVINSIAIESSHLTSLEGENFQNLTHCSEVSFKYNRIRLIDPEFFKGTDNIKYLDISHNELSSIPPKLLDPMKKLETFDASYNQLLHVDNVFSRTQPRKIVLEYNNITNGNLILQLNFEIVKKRMDDTRKDDTVISALYVCNPYWYLRIINEFVFYDIEMIDLSYNSIQDLSYTFLPCYFYAERIYLVRVQAVYLTGNKLQNFNTSMKFSQLITLDSSKNQIRYLTDEDFTKTYGLVNIYLKENQIQRIDRYTFKPIQNTLTILDLSFNLITSVNGSVQYLDNVKTLQLMHNLIQVLADDEFVGLNKLSELFLEHNNIKILGQLQETIKLKYLNIAFNDIRSLKAGQLPSNLKSLKYAENPFECNCLLLPFLLHLNASTNPETDRELCLRPSLNNSLEYILNCPDNCACICTDDGDISYILVDCSSNYLTVVPQFLKYNVTEAIDVEDNTTIISKYPYFVVMNQIIYPSLNIQDHVLGINLENNNLESLDEVQLPPNLLELYLANNTLRWLPESIFENQLNLKRVSLSGNPWNCDCSTLKFKKWLTSNHDAIQDLNETRCGGEKSGTNFNGKIVWTLTDLDLCPSDIGLIVSVSISILILATFCLVAKLMYNRYNLNIKVFLYSRGFTFVKEEDLDHDKVFDAFISFSNNDGEFVAKEIIQEIENRDPNIRLCLHYRHFRPGEFIHDNIILAVQNSKKTILILSKNFLESDWCLLEFKTAHTQVLQDKVHRIILIKVGELPKDIDPSIKLYLDSTTYLTWGEKNFWNKLLYVLPTHSSDSQSVPRNTEDNNDVLNDIFSDV